MKKIPLTPEVIAFRKARASRISRAWAKAHPDRIKAAKKRYLESGHGKAKQKEYTASRPAELKRESCRKWRANHPEKVSACTRAHQKANPEMWAGYASKREARKLAQLHPDANPARIAFIFERAATLSKLTNLPHGVDHIIPLDKGGFHHEDNLQPLPLDLNSSKGNNPLWEHSEYCSWRDVPQKLWPDSLYSTYELLKAA